MRFMIYVAVLAASMLIPRQECNGQTRCKKDVITDGTWEIVKTFNDTAGRIDTATVLKSINSFDLAGSVINFQSDGLYQYTNFITNESTQGSFTLNSKGCSLTLKPSAKGIKITWQVIHLDNDRFIARVIDDKKKEIFVSRRNYPGQVAPGAPGY